MGFQTPAHSAINTSYYTPMDDTFVRARQRTIGTPSNGRVRTSNTIDLTENYDASELLDSNNPVKPTAGISPYTPIKSLVSSPFNANKLTPGRSLTASTPLDADLRLASPTLTRPAPQSPSMLQQKVRDQEQHEYTQTPDKADKTLFSTIYERSVFRPRRTAPTGSSPLRSPEQTYSTINKSAYVEHSEAKDAKKVEPKTPAQPDDALDSPYVRIAQRRIINKESESTQLIKTVIALLFYRFFAAVVQLIVVQLKLKHPQSYSGYQKYQGYLNYAVYILAGIKIVTSAVRLVKPQDQCLDLPLTDQQRKALGLPLVQADENDDSDVATPTVSHKTPMPDITVLKAPTGPGLTQLDISKSFADMNLTSNRSAFNKTPVRAKDTADSTSPEKIKKSLLSSRRKVFPERKDSPVDSSFKKPSNKFIYDLTNDDSTATGLNDTSFY